MLGEGRRWWITSNSDSHVNWTEGGADFWPGEYSKTYVFAEKNHGDILDGLRNGRIFVTLGDLVSELYVTGRTGTMSANIGGTLRINAGDDVEFEVRFLDPDELNESGQDPSVRRVDLILGNNTGPVEDRTTDTNPTAKVLARFDNTRWHSDGDYSVLTYRIENIQKDSYIRIRGTSGSELEPELDPVGENPWSDLWFYSNPIFIEVE
jgi:hypothetical protein